MVRYCAFAIFIVAALLNAGCRTKPMVGTVASSYVPASPQAVQAPMEPKPPLFQPTAPQVAASVPIRAAAFQEPLQQSAPVESRLEELPPADEIHLQPFVSDVVARHPSIEAMIAAWQAAAQRYPQAIALDDPMFMAMGAPASIGSNDVEGAYILELRQKFPACGKRNLRGEAASEEASAAAHDVDDARLKITLLAQAAFIDYYLADRQLALNGQTVELVGQFRDIAQSRYRTNQVTQQDVLQADLELSELARRKLELIKQRRVAIARMNTLLLRSPDAALPKPELAVNSPDFHNDDAFLVEWAVQNRPDLRAQAHRIQVENANLQLAYKQYVPDAELFGRYDTFWQPVTTQSDLRGQVGVSVNLPVYHRKLNAAVFESQAKLRRASAEYEQMAAEVRLDVQTALEQVKESQQAVALYESRLVPAAEQYLAAARSNYEVGKATSLDFVQAQRQVLMAREKQLEAQAMKAQRLAELERSIGGRVPQLMDGP